MLIPRCWGGEVAISDPRSQRPPPTDELARLASEARVAGLCRVKVASTAFHLGMAGGLHPCGAADGTRRPATPALPTHCNRNPWLFAEAIEWGRAGGWVDLTTSFPDLLDDGGGSQPTPRWRCWRQACRLDRISFSSDANASLPFWRRGRLIELRWRLIRPVAGEGGGLLQGVALVTALAVVINPARRWGF